MKLTIDELRNQYLLPMIKSLEPGREEQLADAIIKLFKDNYVMEGSDGL